MGIKPEGVSVGRQILGWRCFFLQPDAGESSSIPFFIVRTLFLRDLPVPLATKDCLTPELDEDEDEE